ncbi:MAG: hypothetical protein E7464_05610 [Ruminococcaceae bacterium]|nr:hypothetical protein [Oscillospiraceae bacterium]
MRMREKKTGGYQRALCMAICVLLLAMLLPVTASADSGPKPSVQVDFENMEGVLCYGTLLGAPELIASPHSIWDGTEEDGNYQGAAYTTGNVLPYNIWKHFAEYEDTDGYCFWQQGWTVSETQEIYWGHYPPQNFKILLYFPDTDTFAVSESYETYAFDSYYTVDMAESDQNSGGTLSVRRSYDYGGEIVGLLARILITIAIEMAIAVSAFGFREKKQLRVLIVVNCVTQILLNVLLNVTGYFNGPISFIVDYIFLETLVFVIEAVVYCIWLRKVSGFQRKKRVYVGYAWVSNTVSFIVGMIIARLLPGIF